MNKEIIKALQENEKPFDEMTPELQKALLSIDPEDVEAKRPWLRITNSQYRPQSHTIHRLRPDYEPESEIVECEIYADDKCLAFDHPCGKRGMNLAYAASGPDFIGFKAHGWLWGCLYKNKEDASMVHCMILEKDLPLYYVLKPESPLFRKQ